VYALGVVLYQVLTGELPFVAETPLAVALMHLHSSMRPPRQRQRPRRAASLPRSG
jgi:serine/threonine-protein kinase